MKRILKLILLGAPAPDEAGIDKLFDLHLEKIMVLAVSVYQKNRSALSLCGIM